ncbi:MAG: hypothetical protein WC217_02240 [Candidatus Paceibacterota bacterium]|jgi:hypothetical protein
MRKRGGAILYWFVGIILTFVVTALPAVLSLVWWAYGISPETLRGLISAWLFGSLIIASLPFSIIVPGIGNDDWVEFFSENGRGMLFYGNPLAWVILLSMSCRKIYKMFFPPDEESVVPGKW